jgi:hypothetical protein
MARVPKEGNGEQIEMTDWATVVVSLALVGMTGGLVYATLGLKDATDHLARAQILPRLILDGEPYYQMALDELEFSVSNKGLATAYDTRAFAVAPNLKRVEAKLVFGGRDISPLNQPSLIIATRFALRGVPDDTEITIELEYKDGEGHPYKLPFLTRTPMRTATTEGGLP